MTHKKEIIRYANSEDGTRVFYKRKDSDTWRLGNFPSWDHETKYIVDDDSALFRKAILDGYTIEIKSIESWDTGWVTYCGDINHLPTDKEDSAYCYRIKPILILHYQFLCRREGTCDYKITTSRYCNIKEAQEARQSGSGWIVIKAILESVKEKELKYEH